MNKQTFGKVFVMHICIIVVLFLLRFWLPDYHQTNLARIMVLATYAIGFNILFGYTGLMSLGHAMFFAAGMYGTGLSIYYLEFGAISGFFIGVVAASVWAAVFAS
ncbi:MAG: ABC transporter permease subunit, partial [Arenicellales bacterium WSBS_2016_MAG_OTU3]